MDEKELREKYAQLQVAGETLKELRSHLDKLKSKQIEISEHIENLSALKGKNEKELLSPIADGIFLKAKLESDTMLIVNVGGNVCVEKSVDDTIKMLSEKNNELSSYIEELSSEVKEVEIAAKSMDEELSALLKAENVQIPKE